MGGRSAQSGGRDAARDARGHPAIVRGPAARRWLLPALGAAVTAAGIPLLPLFADTDATVLAIIAALGGLTAGGALVPWDVRDHARRHRQALDRITRAAERVASRPEDPLPEDDLRAADDGLDRLRGALFALMRTVHATRGKSRVLERNMADGIEREAHRRTAALRAEAMRDPLTGLGNRRRLDAELARLFGEEARRCDDVIAVLVMDLDRFKQVNDTLGHEAGDACLKHLGDVLGATLRGEDVAVRLGGDEFVALLPGHAEDVADTVARRLMALFRQMPWPHAAVGRPTLSIGIACGHRRLPGGADALLRSADEALYRAKAAGRDAVATADPVAARVRPESPGDGRRRSA